MKIDEICNILRGELYNTGYVYGFLLNGEKHVPDISKGFDKEYDQLFRSHYRIHKKRIQKERK